MVLVISISETHNQKKSFNTYGESTECMVEIGDLIIDKLTSDTLIVHYVRDNVDIWTVTARTKNYNTVILPCGTYELLYPRRR